MSNCKTALVQQTGANLLKVSACLLLFGKNISLWKNKGFNNSLSNEKVLRSFNVKFRRMKNKRSLNICLYMNRWVF